MRKILLSNYQSPGDVLMLTAAVRDLHGSYPGQFITDVDTTCAELWHNNPHVTPLKPSDPDVEGIDCHYPLIHHSNQRPVHFVHGFVEYLNERLDLEIRLSEMRGDIHFSTEEKALPSPVHRETGADVPFWIIVAGGKFDFTIKWWHFRRWQAVVDHFKNRLLFVQVGSPHHYHPALDGVLDMRGRTSLRELIHLVYHARGVLCPVTLAMHLAAAVECRPDAPAPRSCVVIAGGREPATWEAYPGHHFLHTIGQLSCCETGGCWRSRSVPLDDGDEKDGPKHLCVNLTGTLPRCMDLITPDVVIRHIDSCLSFDPSSLLTQAQAEQVAPFLSQSDRRRRAVCQTFDGSAFSRP